MSKYIDADKLIAEIRIIQQSLENRDVRFNQVKKIRTECLLELCKCIIDAIATLQQEKPECIYGRTLEEREKCCKFCSAACKVSVEQDHSEVDLDAIVNEAFDKYSSVDGYGQLSVSFNRAELYSFIKKIAGKEERK